MAITYSYVFTSDGSQLFTSDGSPIVVAIRDELEIVCPPDITIVVPTAAVTPIVTWPNPTITGGYPPFTITSNPTSGSTFPVGTTAVEVTVEDLLSDTAVCSFNVTVTVMAAEGCNTGLSNGFTL